jgi:tRNA(fMet)-specific endonuclease VapC
MDESLLDTDMLNEVLKRKNANVTQHAANYLAQYGQFAISSMSWYEVLRGLKEKKATTQLAQFQAFCQNTVLLAITDAVLELATDLWALGRQNGQTPKDADLIIGATALIHGRTLVTGNTPHFGWIPGLVLANWRQP